MNTYIKTYLFIVAIRIYPLFPFIFLKTCDIDICLRQISFQVFFYLSRTAFIFAKFFSSLPVVLTFEFLIKDTCFYSYIKYQTCNINYKVFLLMSKKKRKFLFVFLRLLKEKKRNEKKKFGSIWFSKHFSFFLLFLQIFACLIY